MRDALAEMVLLIPNITDEHQAALIYWDAYRNLVPITNPEERQRIMRLMACGAWLECAALIVERAFPGTLWTASSQRRTPPAIHSAALYSGHQRLADGLSRRHEGDALLLAIVRHTINVRASGAQKASA